MIQLVYITFPTQTEARKVGKYLLEERLAACVNIIPGMQAMYWWEGKIESGKETILLVKTMPKKVKKVVAVVEKMHSYDCPCIEVIDVAGASSEFAEWVREELR